MCALFSATEDVLPTHMYWCSEWECLYVCTGVHVCMFASLCVSAKWYLPICREGRIDLNAFVSLQEQFKQSRHIECLNKPFCSLGRPDANYI